MTEEVRHIERMEDTRAGLIANMDNLQIGIASTNAYDDRGNDLGFRGHHHRDGLGNFRTLAVINEDATFDTLTATTLDITGSVSLSDEALEIYDAGDITKRFRFNAGGITAGQTRVLTTPDSDGTIMLNLVEDVSPQLGGNLDVNGKHIVMADNDADALAFLNVTASIMMFDTTDGTEVIDIFDPFGLEINTLKDPGLYVHNGTVDLLIVNCFSDTQSVVIGDATIVKVTINQTGVAIDDAGTQMAKFNAANDRLDLDVPLFIKERAAAIADVAAYGQVWVKTATPCELWFTDDTGTDTKLA